MGNRTLLAVFIFVVVLLSGVVYWVHESDPKPEGGRLICSSEKSLQVFIDVYYPGKLQPEGYTIEDDEIVLNFREIRSGELQVNRANFTLSCVPRNVSPKLFEIRVGEMTFTPLCVGVITTPVPSGGNATSLSVYYIASPYDLNEVALIVSPEGYSFEGLKLEKDTLMVLVSQEGEKGDAIVKSQVIGERNWVRIVYTNGKQKWIGRKSTMGEGECPIWIFPESGSE